MRLLRLGRQEDDMPTFEAVLKQYERPIYWHIRRMVVNHEDAQDVMQETFIRVYQGLGRCGGSASAKGDSPFESARAHRVQHAVLRRTEL